MKKKLFLVYKEYIILLSFIIVIFRVGKLVLRNNGKVFSYLDFGIFSNWKKKMCVLDNFVLLTWNYGSRF